MNNEKNIKKDEIFIYVGLRKTGSTFLHREIFPKIRNQGFNIISSDDFSGHLNTIIKVDDYCKYKTRENMLTKLKKDYPNANIIIGVREKNEWLKSMYNLYVKQGGFRDYNYWYNNLLNHDYLNFEKYLNELKNNFSNVFVYDFNFIKKDMEGFISDLCNFIGCKIPDYNNKVHRKSWNERQVKLARFINKIIKSKYNPNAPIKRTDKINSSWILWKTGSNWWLGNK